MKKFFKSHLYIIIIIILIFITFGLNISKEVFHNTNELISTISSYIQAICIIIQSVIIYKQLKLEEKVNQKSIKEEKGIFIIEKTNVISDQENQKFFYNKYNLQDNIKFRNVGNGHIILKGQKINTRDIEYTEGTFFTNLKDYSELNINLNLSPKDLEKDLIEVKIKLLLQNLSGYEYVEIIEVTFVREEDGENIYNLKNFNIRLEEVD